MRLLLDTHALLWWLADDPSLCGAARRAIEDPSNMVYVSAVSIWEISIKRGLGKLSIPDDWFEVLSQEALRRIPITWDHAAAVSKLPDIHRDPFDRLLAVQAKAEELIVVTRDDVFARYDLPILKA